MIIEFDISMQYIDLIFPLNMCLRKTRDKYLVLREALGAAPRVLGGGAPWRVCTWVEGPENHPFWRKLNELCENASCDSEFAQAFEIQPLKVAILLFIFLNANFSNASVAE